MKTNGHQFRVLPGSYAVCRMAPGTAIPEWAAGDFVNVTATEDELSVMCPAGQVPAQVQAERDWRVLKLIGPFPFSAVGVLATLVVPLARAGISLLAVATYDTDYVLVRAGSLAAALRALADAGHTQVA